MLEIDRRLPRTLDTCSHELAELLSLLFKGSVAQCACKAWLTQNLNRVPSQVSGGFAKWGLKSKAMPAEAVVIC